MPPVGEDGLGLQADPLADGLAVQVDGELGVERDQRATSISSDAPLPLSAMTSARSSGLGSSPGTSG